MTKDSEVMDSKQFATTHLFISSCLPPGVTAVFELGRMGPCKRFISYAFTEWPRSQLIDY
jgi:hypothetical protein